MMYNYIIFHYAILYYEYNWYIWRGPSLGYKCLKKEIWLFSEISNYELKRIYDQSDPFEGADDKLKKNTLISYSSTDVWEAKNNIFFSQATGCMVSMSIMIRWYFYILFFLFSIMIRSIWVLWTGDCIFRYSYISRTGWPSLGPVIKSVGFNF